MRISDGVTAIGKAAFYGCSRLYSVTLGRNVNQISTGAFNTCRNLVEVINLSPLKIERGDYDNGNVSAYALAVSTSESSRSTHIVDGYLFCDADDNNSYLISYYGEKTHLTLPATYRGEEYLLGNYRAYPFYEHPTIESVDIPEGSRKSDPMRLSVARCFRPFACPIVSKISAMLLSAAVPRCTMCLSAETSLRWAAGCSVPRRFVKQAPMNRVWYICRRGAAASFTCWARRLRFLENTPPKAVPALLPTMRLAAVRRSPESLSRWHAYYRELRVFRL